MPKPTHSPDCRCHNHDYGTEVAKFAGRIIALFVHEQIKKHRPLIAARSKVITWKQFRHLRVQEPASK